MNHYTYEILYSNGLKYLGVRSCKCKPEEDTKYIGSSKYTPNNLLVSKTILRTFKSRKEALQHEQFLQSYANVVENPYYYNRCIQTSTKFDTTGLKLIHTPEHREKIKKSLTGRKRSKEECEAISKAKKGIKRNKPHSAESRLKMSKSMLGKKGYMKGEVYSFEEHLAKYSKRSRYPNRYLWFNEISGVSIFATNIEMGFMYGAGVKPTRCFTELLIGRYRAYKGWVLKQA